VLLGRHTDRDVHRAIAVLLRHRLRSQWQLLHVDVLVGKRELRWTRGLRERSTLLCVRDEHWRTSRLRDLVFALATGW